MPGGNLGDFSVFEEEMTFIQACVDFGVEDFSYSAASTSPKKSTIAP